MSVLKTRTLAAAITDRIRQDILGGQHQAGTPLRQDALAAAYGVSRIPVREALFQLEAEGLVAIEPHRGAVVTPLSRAEIEDIFALRLILENRALAASVPLLTAADFEKIDAVLAAFAAAIRNRDSSRWGALNAGLHLALYARAPMPRTLAMVGSLLQASERYTRVQLSGKAAWQRAQSEHQQLVELCKAKDGGGACALLAVHISTVRDDLVALVEKQSKT